MGRMTRSTFSSNGNLNDKSIKINQPGYITKLLKDLFIDSFSHNTSHTHTNTHNHESKHSILSKWVNRKILTTLYSQKEETIDEEIRVEKEKKCNIM